MMSYGPVRFGEDFMAWHGALCWDSVRYGSDYEVR